MKPMLTESSSDGAVLAARKAYRSVLTRQGLVNFSRKEVDGALASLRSQGCPRIRHGDIQFQAAILRLQSRTDLTAQAAEEALHELLNAEYDCDQAEWERDCHRWTALSHSTFAR